MRQQQRLEQQEQRTEVLEIGLHVLRAQNDSHQVHNKAVPRVGLYEHGASTLSSLLGTNNAKSGSTRSSRSPTRAPSRPSTAPAACNTAADSVYRLWVQELQRAVVDSGLSRSRNIVIRFVAEAGKRYTLVPYTRCVCIEGSSKYIECYKCKCAHQLYMHSLQAGGTSFLRLMLLENAIIAVAQLQFASKTRVPNEVPL